MRADRLITIIMLLQNNGRMTTRELAEKLETSERTIHRDMVALSGSGVPVYSERGSNGGWVLPEDYRTNLTGMNTDELKSLLLAHPTSIIRDLGMQQSLQQAVEKLMASFPSGSTGDAWKVRERIHVDGAGWHQAFEELPNLTMIQEAVWQDRKLAVKYAKDQEEAVERVIEPLGLVAKGGIWYTAAVSDGEMRTFRVSRMAEARLLDETFVRPEDFDLGAYWEHSMRRFQEGLPRYPAVMRFHHSVWGRAGRQRYMKVINEEPEGKEWRKMTVEFNTLESASEIILGYGDKAEAVAPAELRDFIKTRAAAILSRYHP